MDLRETLDNKTSWGILALVVIVLILFVRCSADNPTENRTAPKAITPAASGSYIRLLLQTENADNALINVNLSGDGKRAVAGIGNRIAFINVPEKKVRATTINNLNTSVSDVIASKDGETAVYRYVWGQLIGIIDSKFQTFWSMKLDNAYSMDATGDLSVVAVVTMPPDNKPGGLAIETEDKEKGIKFTDSTGSDVSVSQSGNYIAVAKGGFDIIIDTKEGPDVRSSGFNGASLYNREGDLLWNYRTKKHALCIKILDNKRLVIVGDDSGLITALNLRNGKPVWSGEYGGYFAANDDFIIARKDGTVAMFSTNGDLLWRSNIYPGIYCGKQCIAVSKSGNSIVGTIANYDALVFDRSGNLLWQKRYNARPVVSMSEDGKTWAVGDNRVEIYEITK
ncbi:MAG: hypothetical protein A2X59_03015 [Nitrospirae bacterium GWC2_42_7]|nr:MAG: hypothetical protein A2X59_03015 [Nitrospirae bacterium GWC2_42_7]